MTGSIEILTVRVSALVPGDVIRNDQHSRTRQANTRWRQVSKVTPGDNGTVYLAFSDPDMPFPYNEFDLVECQVIKG